jgi:DNA repair photolyase
MPQPTPPAFFPRGRGTPENPRNRFEQTVVIPDWEQLPTDEIMEPRRVDTRFIPDESRSIISHNDSPDLPFRHSINPYRGCEHGCVYCYARPTHEYLGFSAGLDFETKIMVKARAPELLEAALAHPRWEPAWVNMSGVTDCYQPAERHYCLTRGCLAMLARYRNPVTIVTKNSLVIRDIDLLGEMARWQGAAVLVSLTTLDADLARRMEPRTASPRHRLETVSRLSQAGIPVGVNMAPIIPGLNDTEMPELVSAATRAGACFAHCQVLRLPFAVKDLFVNWVGRESPHKKDRILSRINELRGSKNRLNDAQFGTRMTGQGIWKETYARMFALACHRAGLQPAAFELNVGEFRRPGPSQGSLPG